MIQAPLKIAVFDTEDQVEARELAAFLAKNSISITIISIHTAGATKQFQYGDSAVHHWVTVLYVVYGGSV